MSTLIGDRLPAHVREIFDVTERDRADGQCLLLITVDADGQPRPCLLSVGEMIATDSSTLRALTWPNSQTTANLERGLPVLLVLAVPPDVIHIRAIPSRLPDAPGSTLARFTFTIRTVEVDGHDGLPVTQPMWFAARPDLVDKTLTMWRAQLRVLQY